MFDHSQPSYVEAHCGGSLYQPYPEEVITTGVWVEGVCVNVHVCVTQCRRGVCARAYTDVYRYVYGNVCTRACLCARVCVRVCV